MPSKIQRRRNDLSYVLKRTPKKLKLNTMNGIKEPAKDRDFPNIVTGSPGATTIKMTVPVVCRQHQRDVLLTLNVPKPYHPALARSAIFKNRTIT
jgi:hypothetical protein